MSQCFNSLHAFAVSGVWLCLICMPALVSGLVVRTVVVSCCVSSNRFAVASVCVGSQVRCHCVLGRTVHIRTSMPASMHRQWLPGAALSVGHCMCNLFCTRTFYTTSLNNVRAAAQKIKRQFSKAILNKTNVICTKKNVILILCFERGMPFCLFCSVL